MLDICLHIAHIDYKRSLAGLYPAVRSRIAAREKLRELDKLLGRLGGDALPVAEMLLDYVSDSAKIDIAVWYINSHGAKLAETVNAALARRLSGSAVRIGSVHAERLFGNRLALLASQVEIDCAALLASPLVERKLDELSGESALLRSAARLALSMGTRMSPDSLEKLLSSEKVQAKLLDALREALEHTGLYMEFQRMELRQDTATSLPAELPAQEDKGFIPDAFEDALLDALAAWLRDAACMRRSSHS